MTYQDPFNPLPRDWDRNDRPQDTAYRSGRPYSGAAVLAGVAVVPGLRAEGGQVAHGPGGVVLQAGRDRHLEGLLQLDPPIRVFTVAARSVRRLLPKARTV